ncbi:MAG: DNA methyltransferase [Candidatus Hodarchaeales archaeon]|jgi:DNA modification methylase
MSEAETTFTYQYEFSDDKWKLATGNYYGRLTGHSLHYIGPYSGSFPPELVYYFLKKYSVENATVLDPFSGRGTTGLEAVLNNRKVVVNDANPLAFVYSYAKLFPFASKEVDSYLDHIPFREESFSSSLTEEKQYELESYYHKDTLLEMRNLRQYLKNDDSPMGYFVKALLAGTSQGNRISNLSVTMSALICFSAKYMRKWSEKTGVYPEYREIQSRLVAKAERLEKDGLKFRRDSTVLCGDAQNLGIDSNSIDLIITSPPYFNVINYAYDNRVRLWMIGSDYKTTHRALMNTSSIPKYTDFVQNTMKELYRVLKDDSWAIIVVGDVKRKKTNPKNKNDFTIINTAEIVGKSAEKNGFNVDKIINDALPEQGGTCGRATSLTNSFNVSIDRCVVLKKGNPDEYSDKIYWGKPKKRTKRKN